MSLWECPAKLVQDSQHILTNSTSAPAHLLPRWVPPVAEMHLSDAEGVDVAHCLAAQVNKRHTYFSFAGNACLKTFPHKCLTIRLKHFNASFAGDEWVQLLNHPPRRIASNQPVRKGKTKSYSLKKLTAHKPKLLDIFGQSHLGKFNGVCAEQNRITTWVNTKSEAGLAMADQASG